MHWWLYTTLHRGVSVVFISKTIIIAVFDIWEVRSLGQKAITRNCNNQKLNLGLLLESATSSSIGIWRNLYEVRYSEIGHLRSTYRIRQTDIYTEHSPNWHLHWTICQRMYILHKSHNKQQPKSRYFFDFTCLYDVRTSVSGSWMGRGYHKCTRNGPWPVGRTQFLCVISNYWYFHFWICKYFLCPLEGCWLGRKCSFLWPRIGRRKRFSWRFINPPAGSPACSLCERVMSAQYKSTDNSAFCLDSLKQVHALVLHTTRKLQVM